MSGRRLVRRGAVTATILGLLALLASAAALGASSGTIGRAQVSSDWSNASISGVAADLDGCPEPPEEPGPPEGPKPPEEPGGPGWPEEPGPGWQNSFECSWIPYATVGPGTAAADCSSHDRRPGSIGDGVQLVWTGEELKGAGSAGFDLNGVALDYGSDAPLLCLAVVEAVPDPVRCEQLGGGDCGGYGTAYEYEQLDSAILEPEAPIVVPPVESAAPGPNPPSSQPCRAVKHNRHGLKRSQRLHRKRKARAKVSRRTATSPAKRKPFRRCAKSHRPL